MVPAVMSSQMAFLAVAVTGAGITGATEFALAACAAVFLAAAALYGRYRRDLGARQEQPSPTRVAGDRRVRWQWWFGTLTPVALVLAVTASGLQITTPDLLSAILVAATVGAATVYSSSLVDWYWVLPRISGLVQIEHDASSWRQLTSVWLTHRAVAKLVVSMVPIAVLVYAATTTADETMRTALFVAAGLAGAALAPLNEGFRLALQPPVHVGDVVKLPEGAAAILDMSMNGARYVLLSRTSHPTQRLYADGLIPLRDLGRYPRIAGGADETTRASVERFWGESAGARAHWPLESPAQTGATAATEQTRSLNPHGESRATAISLFILTTVTVIALAVTALRFVIDGAGAAVGTIMVGAAVIGVAGLVHSVVTLRRRAVLERARIPAVPLDHQLVVLSGCVDAQRASLRSQLGDLEMTQRGRR